MNAGLAPLRSFVLPGGTPLAAALHLCRTVCRRAEREAVALAAAEPVNPEAVRYLNRLSDWLFVAGRVANDGGRARRALGAGRQSLRRADRVAVTIAGAAVFKSSRGFCSNRSWGRAAARDAGSGVRCSRASACRWSTAGRSC